jgi:hypothetical protein
VVNATVAKASPGVTVEIVGASGTVAGVTVVLPDATLVPLALVAVTVKVYSVPFVNPVTRWLVDVEPTLPTALVSVPAGLEVTV